MNSKRSYKFIFTLISIFSIFTSGIYFLYQDASATDTIVNTRSELIAAAQNASITNIKLGNDITTNNSIAWTITTADRTLDLNGHTIRGVSDAVNAIFVFNFNGPSASSGTVYNRTLTIKNGSIIQKNSNNQTSQSTLYFNTSGRIHIKIYLNDVNITASSHDIYGILTFNRPPNYLYKRYLEVDGGNFDGARLVNFVEPGTNDSIKIKRLTLKHSRPDSPTTSLFNSSNFTLSQVIDSSATVYKDSTKITDLSSGNLNHRGTIYIKAPAPDFSVHIDNWSYGDSPNQPTIEGEVDDTQIEYSYRSIDASDWSNTIPADAGKYIIKATLNATDQYEKGESTANFEVNKAEAELVFLNDIIEKQLDTQSFSNPIIKKSSDGELSFISNNESVVSVDSNTGEMVALQSGATTITATVTESNNYKSTSASFIVKIIESPSEQIDDEAPKNTSPDQKRGDIKSPDTGNYTANPSLASTNLEITLLIALLLAFTTIIMRNTNNRDE